MLLYGCGNFSGMPFWNPSYRLKFIMLLNLPVILSGNSLNPPIILKIV